MEMIFRLTWLISVPLACVMVGIKKEQEHF